MDSLELFGFFFKESVGWFPFLERSPGSLTNKMQHGTLSDSFSDFYSLNDIPNLVERSCFLWVYIKHGT